MTKIREGRPTTGAQPTTPDAVSVPAHGNDALLPPVVVAVFAAPCAGRTRTEAWVLDCPVCHHQHRHVATQEGPRGLYRACQTFGTPYIVMPEPLRRAVRRG